MRLPSDRSARFHGMMPNYEQTVNNVNSVLKIDIRDAEGS